MKTRKILAVLAVVVCTVIAMSIGASASTLGIITKAEIVNIESNETIVMDVGETVKLVPTQEKTALIWSGEVAEGLAFEGDKDVVIEATKLATPEYERRYAERVYAVEGAYRFTAEQAGLYTLEIYTPNYEQTRTIYIAVA